MILNLMTHSLSILTSLFDFSFVLKKFIGYELLYLFWGLVSLVMVYGIICVMPCYLFLIIRLTLYMMTLVVKMLDCVLALVDVLFL